MAGGAVVADFGAVYPARPQIEFAQGQAGNTISMRAGYLLDPDGQVSTLHGTQETNLSFSYIMGPGGHQAFEAFTYFGYRYVQIDNPGQALSRDQIVAITRRAAMPDVPTATFSSDNRMLNAVWRLMARSCLYCSQEQFVDTPTREKGQFLWDAANESEAVMRVYGDQNMSWQALRDVARGQARYWPNGCVNAIYPNDDGARFFGTSTARYAEWLWRYYVSTGDTDTAVQFYPSVHAGGGLAVVGPPGRQRAPLRAGRHQRRRPRLRLRPLRGGGHGEQRAGGQRLQPGGAAGRRWPATQPARRPSGRGPSSWPGRSTRPSGAPTVSTWTASTPTAPRVAAPRRRPTRWRWPTGWSRRPNVAAVGAYVHSLGIDLGPNHGLELMRALAAADLPEAMVQTLTDTSIPGWAHIVAAGGTFTWEEWKPSDLIGDSMSHGWGSSALVASSTSRRGWPSTRRRRGDRRHGQLQGAGARGPERDALRAGMTAGHLYTVAGTGVCGSAGQGGPVAAAQLWNPVAVAVDSAGDLLVADDGDQSVLLAPRAAGPSTAPRSAPATSASSWAGRAGTSRISPTVSPRWARPRSSTTPGGSPSVRPARCSSPTASCRSSEWCRRPPARCSGGR